VRCDIAAEETAVPESQAGSFQSGASGAIWVNTLKDAYAGAGKISPTAEAGHIPSSANAEGRKKYFKCPWR
jgi:hypothetical protein